MSYVLYYSKYCENCKKILYKVGKDKVKDDIHFLCIDKRKVTKGKVYIVLSDGKELLMPDEIKEVPALLLLNRGNRIIYGNEILELFNPILEKNNVTNLNGGEPLAFSNYEMSATLSDNYSYLDQNPDDLSTKGEGGLQRISKINMKSNERESTDFAVKIRISRNFPVSGWPRPGCLRPDARFVPCPASSVYYDHCGQKHLFTIPKPTLAHLRTRMRARTHRAGETAIIIRTRLEIEAAEENDDQKADKGEHRFTVTIRCDRIETHRGPLSRISLT